MKHYKAIILAIASEDQYNDQYIMKKIMPEWRPLLPYFKSVHEQYMNEREDMRMFFLYGAGEKSFVPQEHDLIFENIKENDYPGIIAKTLNAMELVHNTYSYDYIIRTNLSTFWDLNMLAERLDTLPKTECITGHLARTLEESKELYISGYDMVISRDLVEKILPYKEEIIAQKVWQNLEDLSLCLAIKKYTTAAQVQEYSTRDKALYMTFDPFTEEELFKVLNASKKSKVDHFRVKNRKNRNIDKYIMKILLQEIYGKSIL